MKYYLSLILIFSSFYVNGQIRGNGKIITKVVTVEAFTSIELGLFAEYEVNLSEEQSLEITIDENLLEFVEKSVRDNTLHIDQLEWIKSSQKIRVKIGAAMIEKLTQTSHAKTLVNDIDQKRLSVDAQVGELILSGKVTDLAIRVNTAKVDANNLQAVSANFEIGSWGTIKAKVEGDVKSSINGNGNLYINGVSQNKESKILDENIKFIKFVLKNNSANRHQFYVVGPKPDGSSFSYGFPMMPYQRRDKDWTNGTKVYKVNLLGIKKLVKTISLTDEGEIVDIFSK